jgi:Flp pilus assembly protein CpaB
MRPRTLLLIILFIVLVGVVALYGITQLRQNNSVTTAANDVAVTDNAIVEGQVDTGAEEPNLPSPTATPEVLFADVVVARTNIPQGRRIMAEFVQVVQRPLNNVAVVAGMTFDDPELVVGQIAKSNIAQGQEVMVPMLALNASDLAGFGSDLAIYVDNGKVAIAFPIDRYSGLAYAMRPGDFVDVMMSVPLIEIDPEFKTALPNEMQIVNQEALLSGQTFLFPATTQGRLELIPDINLVASITPGGGQDGVQYPRRITQLTVQQSEVLWVGTWVDPRDALLVQQVVAEEGGVVVASDEGEGGGEDLLTAPIQGQPGDVQGTPTPTKERPEDRPDVIILSMPVQDALVLKWALERGVDMDLTLRAQGDNSIFFTTSVTLPQLVEQGGLTIPEAGDYDIEERADEVQVPQLPDVNPNN